MKYVIFNKADSTFLYIDETGSKMLVQDAKKATFFTSKVRAINSKPESPEWVIKPITKENYLILMSME